jgi:hypothetical protein
MVLMMDTDQQSGTILEHVARVGKGLEQNWSKYVLIGHFFNKNQPIYSYLALLTPLGMPVILCHPSISLSRSMQRDQRHKDVNTSLCE